MYRFLIGFILLTCALFSAGPSPLWAEEKIRVKEVVVTATRTEAEIEKIPANVTVISQEKILKSKAKTVQELLRAEEGMIVIDLFGNGAKSSVDMRGFDRGINTAVLIDGVKVNEIDLSGVDWNLIPLEKVEKIEIVRGSGSVLYGDNAMAGVINIITKKGTSLQPSAKVDLRAESYGGNAEQASFEVATERIGFFGLLKNRRTNGYRENSEFDAQDAAGNFTLTITDSLLADIRLGYHTDHQGYPGALFLHEIKNDRRQSTEPKNGADYEQFYYGAKILFTKPWGDIEGGYHFNSREFDAQDLGRYFDEWLDSWVSYEYRPTRETDMQDMKFKAVIKKPLLGYANKLVAGLDYTVTKVNAVTRYIDDAYGPSDTKTDLKKIETGLYIEDEFFLTDKWIIIGGYRRTYAKFDDKVVSTYYSGSGSQSFTTDSFNVGIAYNYTIGGKVFANYSRGFRLPTTDELFSYDGLVLRLKPEKSNTYEIGIVHPFQKKTQLRFTLYRMDVRDELFLNPDKNLPFGENDNIDKTRHEGFELGFSTAVIDDVTIFGNWTYSKVTFESGSYKGKTMPLRPLNTVNVGAEIKVIDNLLLWIQGNWVDKRFLLNDVQNTLKKLSDYATVDARLSYNYKLITAYIGVNNIFDKKYLTTGSVSPSSDTIVKFQPAPERNFFAGLTFRF